MDSLVKQIRVKYSGTQRQKTEETGSIRDGRLPPQRTQSFKEKKKSQSWFQRQFTRQGSQDYDANNVIEYATAVAAVAFAINNLEEQPETSLTSIKSNKEDTRSLAQEPGRASQRFSGETSMKLPEGKDTKVPLTAAASGKTPQKSIGPAPSVKKSPTFAEHLNKTDSIKPESAEPKPDLPATIKPAMPGIETRRQSSMKSVEETQAEAWERVELAKIKERYEKLNITILSWEEKKRAKARHRLQRTEREVEQRRLKASEKYRSEMDYISQVAGGAKAQAEERRRNEESKTKEKANTFRTTGKFPKKCLCL